jgi:hypothetical protein
MNNEEKKTQTEQQEQTEQTQETTQEKEKFTIPQEVLKKYF